METAIRPLISAILPLIFKDLEWKSPFTSNIPRLFPETEIVVVSAASPPSGSRSEGPEIRCWWQVGAETCSLCVCEFVYTCVF